VLFYPRYLLSVFIFILSSLALNLVTNSENRRRWLIWHVIIVNQIRATKKYFENKPSRQKKMGGKD
jgi:hypothetical protein